MAVDVTLGERRSIRRCRRGCAEPASQRREAEAHGADGEELRDEAHELPGGLRPDDERLRLHVQWFSVT